MAERRMFSKKITDADAFTELPPTTQAFYFHLCMGCDDDGFSNQIRKAMFNAHADRNDFELLVNKRFIIPFDSGVIVIKHWRLHNLIKNDRYHETDYVEEKSRLVLKENGIYSEHVGTQVEPKWNPNGTQMEPKWNPSGTKVEPEVSIGKESIDKVKSINTLDQFEALWSIYPRKQGKKSAFESFKRAIRDGVTPDEIRTGIEAYCNYIRVTGTDAKYIKQGSTFFNQRAWADDWTPTRKKDSLAQKFEDMDSW